MEIFVVVEFPQVVGVGIGPWVREWFVFGAMLLGGVGELVEV